MNFLRNSSTGGAVHRAMSSGEGVKTAACVACGVVCAVRGTEYAAEEVSAGATGLGAGAGAEGRTGGVYGAVDDVSNINTNDDALGKRRSGSFSRSVITVAAKSGGTSGRLCSTGVARSVRCFINIDAVVAAAKGSSPVSIWYATTPSE